MTGFTKAETRVILFLVISFAAGLGVKAYREKWEPLPEPELKQEEQRPSERVVYGDSLHLKRVETVIDTSEESNGLIDINHADEKTLRELPGVGEVIAERIVVYRSKHGAFACVEDLKNIKGIGTVTAGKIGMLATVK